MVAQPPTPPSRSDPPDVFIARMDATIAWWAQVAADINAPPLTTVDVNMTLALTDLGKTFRHPNYDTTARTWTIPSNLSVPFAPGTRFKFINQNSGGIITIAITTDNLRLSPGGATGSRSLAANGVATLIKVASAEWIIYGTGLT